MSDSHTQVVYSVLIFFSRCCADILSVWLVISRDYIIFPQWGSECKNVGTGSVKDKHRTIALATESKLNVYWRNKKSDGRQK